MQFIARHPDGATVERDCAPLSVELAARYVGSLSSRRRKHFRIWTLRRRDGWSPDDIADLTGLHADSVRRIVRAWDRQLRQIFL